MSDEQAYDLVTSPEAQKALDVHNEPDKVRDAYGRNAFGQRALLARRSAVRFAAGVSEEKSTTRMSSSSHGTPEYCEMP